MTKSGAAQSFLFLVTLFGLIFQGSDGVKDVQLEGPRYARRGEDLMLRCNYNLEADSLYAVKWYRGSVEFYRYLPKEAPPKQAFPINGVVVDVNKSDDHSVFLRNLSFETNGRFKCVISVEGTFETLENAKDIEIIVIDYNSPKLYLDKMGYQPGERGIANCSVEQTYPAPNITWFINGKQIHHLVSTRVVNATEEKPVKQQKGGRGYGYGYTTPYSSSGGGYGYAVTGSGSRIVSTTTTVTSSTTEGGVVVGERKNTKNNFVAGGGLDENKKDGNGEEKKKQLTSSVSTLIFPISGYSPLTIKCMGSLYDVYNETSSILIQPKAPTISTYNSNSRDSTGSTPRSQHKKYGMPNQLQTFNQTAAMSNHGDTHLHHSTALPLYIVGLIIVFTTAASSTTAQIPGIPECPLRGRLVG